LPFIIVVKPNVLPLPLERIVSTVLLLPSVALPFQVVLIDCGEVTATTTDQLLAPLTVTVVLYRSPQTVPAVTDVVQVLPPGGGVVGLPPGGGVVGLPPPGLPLFSAVRTASYAGFFWPLPLNSSGLSPDRHESESRTPHTVMPLQRETARQSLTTLRYASAGALRMSSSVMCTSTPRAAKLDSVVR
jgi:hypothetical protein